MSDQPVAPFRSAIFRSAALDAYVQPQLELTDVREPCIGLGWVWGVVSLLVLALLVIWPLGLIG